MSLGAIIAVAVAGLVGSVLVSVRIDVAKQRRKVARARAHLASAKIRRRASDVPVALAFQSGGGLARVARIATCVLGDDGFYCMSNDGAWGARVPFAPGKPGDGDLALGSPPALVKGGAAVDANLPGWLAANLKSLPPDGLLLQFQDGFVWLVAVPDADGWFAALREAIRDPGAAATS
jgi:hypothetical protein